MWKEKEKDSKICVCKKRSYFFINFGRYTKKQTKKMSLNRVNQEDRTLLKYFGAANGNQAD